MQTHSHPQRHITSGRAHKGHGGLSVENFRRCSGTCRYQLTLGTMAPAIILLAVACFALMAGCSQQPSQEVLNQINARLEQSEQRLTQLEEQNTRFEEAMSNVQSSFISIDEKIASLTQQLEKMASRPASPAAKKSAESSAPAPEGKKQYHTVSRGETLYSISRKYGLSVEEVRRLNNLGANQPIKAGQKLVVVSE